jgi:hypothetical protein
VGDLEFDETDRRGVLGGDFILKAKEEDFSHTTSSDAT